MLHFSALTHRLLPLLILTIAVLTGTRQASAGPYDLKPFASGDVMDLTLDATEGALYFHLRGLNYVYRPPVRSPISLADLARAIQSSETILIEEVNPRRTADYYDGRPAHALSRILVKPCPPGHR